MIYAVYRVYYGEDYIVESINSVLPYVDKVIIMWKDKPWRGVTHIEHNGKKVPVKDPIDNVLYKIMQLKKNSQKIEFVYDEGDGPERQFSTHGNKVIELYGKPDFLIQLQTDHVYRDGAIPVLLDELENSGHTLGIARQVYLWKNPGWRIPESYSRDLVGSWFWHTAQLDSIPIIDVDNFGGARIACNAVWLEKEPTFNTGYAIKNENMFWRFYTRLANGIDTPMKGWYEEVYSVWDADEHNVIGWGMAGYSYDYAAIPMDVELPKSLEERK